MVILVAVNLLGVTTMRHQIFGVLVIAIAGPGCTDSTSGFSTNPDAVADVPPATGGTGGSAGAGGGGGAGGISGTGGAGGMFPCGRACAPGQVCCTDCDGRPIGCYAGCPGAACLPRDGGGPPKVDGSADGPVACTGGGTDSCPAGYLCEPPTWPPPGDFRSRCAGFQGTCILKAGQCPAVAMPVCGCNLKTYSNDCVRQAAGVAKMQNGECPPPPPGG